MAHQLARLDARFDHPRRHHADKHEGLVDRRAHEADPLFPGLFQLRGDLVAGGLERVTVRGDVVHTADQQPFCFPGFDLAAPIGEEIHCSLEGGLFQPLDLLVQPLLLLEQLLQLLRRR